MIAAETADTFSVFCDICGGQEVVEAISPAKAMQRAVISGWHLAPENTDDHVHLCPNCPEFAD